MKIKKHAKCPLCFKCMKLINYKLDSNSNFIWRHHHEDRNWCDKCKMWFTKNGFIRKINKFYIHVYSGGTLIFNTLAGGRDRFINVNLKSKKYIFLNYYLKLKTLQNLTLDKIKTLITFS